MLPATRDSNTLKYWAQAQLNQAKLADELQSFHYFPLSLQWHAVCDGGLKVQYLAWRRHKSAAILKHCHSGVATAPCCLKAPSVSLVT